jgi:hypothetical protein
VRSRTREYLLSISDESAGRRFRNAPHCDLVVRHATQDPAPREAGCRPSTTPSPTASALYSVPSARETAGSMSRPTDYHGGATGWPPPRLLPGAGAVVSAESLSDRSRWPCGGRPTVRGGSRFRCPGEQGQPSTSAASERPQLRPQDGPCVWRRGPRRGGSRPAARHQETGPGGGDREGRDAAGERGCGGNDKTPGKRPTRSRAGCEPPQLADLVLAPRVGFEPTTLRLTAGCSTVELPRNDLRREAGTRPLDDQQGEAVY